jgi:hypothetical protein
MNTCATCHHANISGYAFEGHCKLDGHEITSFTVNCGVYVNKAKRRRAGELRMLDEQRKTVGSVV